MRILILCTGNSCRSQMAHGLLESFDKNGTIEVYSAGTRPAQQVNPLAVEAMQEIGIDISAHTPHNVNEYLHQEWDYVITVCGGANESCPTFTGKVKHRLHMGFEDPSEATGTQEFIKGEFRRVRNQIKTEFQKFYYTNIEKLTVLYFGSFNPFHIGHASVARFVAQLPWVDNVCFVLSPKNPIKESNTLQDANLRWADLQRVVRKLNAELGYEKFSASDIEFHLEPPLYTYNTLVRLEKDFPHRHFAILMGGDNINILHKWYRGVEIMQKCPILVYPRQGFDTEVICQEKGAIFIDAPQVDVSSTQIRTIEAAGKDASHLRY